MNADTIASIITRHQNRGDNTETPAALSALRDLACGVLNEIDKQRRFMASMGLRGGWDKPTPDELALRKATGAGEPEPLVYSQPPKVELISGAVNRPTGAHPWPECLPTPKPGFVWRSIGTVLGADRWEIQPETPLATTEFQVKLPVRYQRRRHAIARHDRERFEAASSIIHRGQLAMLGQTPTDPVLSQISPPNLYDIVRAALVIEAQIHALKGRTNVYQDNQSELDYWMSVAFECMEHLANAQPDANSIIPPESPTPRYVHTDAENAVRVRISSMPGGGAYTSLNTAGRRVGFNGTTPCPITMDSVAAYLGELSAIRHYELEEHGRVKAKLDSLQTAIGGAQKLFGILSGGPL